jgi:hypothetical protein
MVTKEEVLLECTKNNRICPMPPKWDALYRLIASKKRPGDTGLPVPLILGGWRLPGKALILEIQINFAADHNALDEVYSFLLSLSESDWHHTTDRL